MRESFIDIIQHMCGNNQYICIDYYEKRIKWRSENLKK